MTVDNSTAKHLFVHKTRIHVNNQQANFLRGCAGFRRVAYNWALSHIKEAWETENRRISIGDTDKAFNAIKREQFSWAYDYPSCVGQLAIKADLKSAFDGFFRRVKMGGQPGYPRFKGRRAPKSLKFSNVVVRDKHISSSYLLLPKDQGLCRTGCETRHRGRLLSTALSESGGKWYAAMLYELDYEPEYKSAPSAAIGIDMGVAKRFVYSDGREIESPEKLKSLDIRKRRIQKKMSKRQKPGKGKAASNRWKKLNASVNKIERKRSLLRKEQANQITADLTKNNSLIVIEDLKIKNMTKSAKGTIDSPGKNVKQKSGLNRVIQNSAWGEVRRQLEYKSKRHKGMVLAVDPKHTSQKCSECGHISPSNRKSQAVFICSSCGFSLNADHNASINILNRGILSLSG